MAGGDGKEPCGVLTGDDEPLGRSFIRFIRGAHIVATLNLSAAMWCFQYFLPSAAFKVLTVKWLCINIRASVILQCMSHTGLCHMLIAGVSASEMIPPRPSSEMAFGLVS